jgi:hypothetical protein
MCISNNASNNFLSAIVLPDFTKNMALKKLFEELFRGITLDDVFDDVILTKTRNNVRRTKTADTLVGQESDGEWEWDLLSAAKLNYDLSFSSSVI